MDTVLEFLLNLFYGLGALVCWVAKGGKTSIKEELSDQHKYRNAFLALLFFAFLIAVVIYINN
jgi:hypothetical protein